MFQDNRRAPVAHSQMIPQTGRLGAAIFLPLAFACAGLLGVIAAPHVQNMMGVAAVDGTITGSIHKAVAQKPSAPVASGYGIDEHAVHHVSGTGETGYGIDE